MAEDYDEELIEAEVRERRNARAALRDEQRRQSIALEQIADELFRIRRLLLARDARLR